MWLFLLKIIISINNSSGVIYFKEYINIFKNELENIIINSNNLTNEWNHILLYKNWQKCVMYNKNATFNYSIWPKCGIYCVNHMNNEMVDVRSIKCLYNGCEKHPSFGYEEDGIRQYCKDHKENR